MAIAVHPSILFVLGFLEPTAVSQATGRETMDGWSVNFEFFFFNFSFNKLYYIIHFWNYYMF